MKPVLYKDREKLYKSGISKNNAHYQHRIVILDMNGLLCKKVLKNSKYSPSDRKIKSVNIKNYKLYIRPGVQDFINRLLKSYKVAIFSSTTATSVSLLRRPGPRAAAGASVQPVWSR